MDQEVKRALDEIAMGAAGVGVCIARIVGKSDPKILQAIAEEGNTMRQHLAAHGKDNASIVLAHFYNALCNPENMPLLSPGVE